MVWLLLTKLDGYGEHDSQPWLVPAVAAFTVCYGALMSLLWSDEMFRQSRLFDDDTDDQQDDYVLSSLLAEGRGSRAAAGGLSGDDGGRAIEGLSFSAYHRVSTVIFVAGAVRIRGRDGDHRPCGSRGGTRARHRENP